MAGRVGSRPKDENGVSVADCQEVSPNVMGRPRLRLAAFVMPIEQRIEESRLKPQESEKFPAVSMLSLAHDLLDLWLQNSGQLYNNLYGS